MATVTETRPANGRLAPPAEIGRGPQTNEAGTEIVLASAANLTQDRIDLLKRTICKGATQDEFDLFVARCRQTGLDPFSGQIMAIQRFDGRESRKVMSIQVGIHGLRLIAERTGNYAPGAETEYAYDGQNALWSARAFVKKWSRGEWHVVSETAFFDEYVQVNKDGRPTGLWGSKPHVMLNKCAEALALRKAFPQETSGLYVREEMMQDDAPPPHRLAPDAPLVDASADARWGLCAAITALFTTAQGTDAAQYQRLKTARAALFGTRKFTDLTDAEIQSLHTALVAALPPTVEPDGVIEGQIVEPPTEKAGEEDDPFAADAEEIAAHAATALKCAGCSKDVTPAQRDLSVRAYGECLCPICQKRKPPAPKQASAPPDAKTGQAKA